MNHIRDVIESLASTGEEMDGYQARNGVLVMILEFAN